MKKPIQKFLIRVVGLLTILIFAFSTPLSAGASTKAPTNAVFSSNCNSKLAEFKPAQIKTFGKQKIENRVKYLDGRQKLVDSRYPKLNSRLTSIKESEGVITLHDQELKAEIKTAQSKLSAKKRTLQSSSDPATLAQTVCSLTTDLATYNYIGNKVSYQINLDTLTVNNELADARYANATTAFNKLKQKSPSKAATIQTSYNSLGYPPENTTQIALLQSQLDSITPQSITNSNEKAKTIFKDKLSGKDKLFMDIAGNTATIKQFQTLLAATNKTVASKTAANTNSSNTRPKKPSAYMVGDSITVGAEGPLRDELSKRGYKSVKINASGSRSIIGRGVTGDKTSGLQAIDDDKEFIKRSETNTIIIALGTNYNNDFEGSMKDIITKIRHYNNHATIYWVNIFSQGGVNGPLINRSIQKLSSTNDFTIIHTVNKGISLEPDHIHPDAAGDKKFAKLVASGAKSAD